jgi:hypothetical protein
MYSHSHAMLLSRFRAHPHALSRLTPGQAAAVLRALTSGDEQDVDVNLSCRDQLRPRPRSGAHGAPRLLGSAEDADAAHASSFPDDTGPVCGITLEALLDAKGRLLPTTVALIQPDATGALHAHLYRGDALATWLAVSGRGRHPSTRAAVDLHRDVHPLC